MVGSGWRESLPGWLEGVVVAAPVGGGDCVCVPDRTIPDRASANDPESYSSVYTSVWL